MEIAYAILVFVVAEIVISLFLGRWLGLAARHYAPPPVDSTDDDEVY